MTETVCDFETFCQVTGPPSEKGKRVDEEQRAFFAAILGALESFPDAEYLAVFQNVTLDSSELGRQQVLIVGPSNTYTTPADCVGRWLNDLPSQRQHFQTCIPVVDFRAGVEQLAT